jgi:hypothetical protein
MPGLGARNGGGDKDDSLRDLLLRMAVKGAVVSAWPAGWKCRWSVACTMTGIIGCCGGAEWEEVVVVL